ncbi:MAG: hypothetical protein NC338_01315 [Firmicutes bacterium]|nr:hypothetical protein [Bacillota bacterium]MCM1401029.1 hypothetical protein [Bacteroides sp.]MCM1476948.1 hypothetical protein [Bacteroides sp.]
MEGKIFPSSSNIYQDQARILFNYYKMAADKIVAEEERIEEEIDSLQKEKAEYEEKLSKTWYWYLTIILFFMAFVKKSEFTKKINQIDEQIAQKQKEHSEIFRDYKISKLGVAYVPVADQVKYDDKSFMVDFTGEVPDSEVSLKLPRQNQLLVDTIGRIDQLATEAPLVETSEDTETLETSDYSTSIQEVNEHDYLGALERSLRTVSYCMEDVDTVSVSLPLVQRESAYMNFIDEFATDSVPKGAPVLNVFNAERYTERIDRFRELNKLKDSLSSESKHFEDVIKGLMSTMATSVQAISALKVASVDKVIFESNRLLYQILKAPYNHYSPILEYDEIERIRNEKFDYSQDVEDYEPFNLRPSSRMKFNLLSGMWTSEDGNVSSMPFGVHQIIEEIMAPVVQNLMAENRIERLRIYNGIKDQKISYLNKWHQDTDAFYRANRAESADIINLMQESLREYVAAYNTLDSLQRTESSMVESGENLDSTVVETVENTDESIAAFELQSQEFQRVQQDFEDYMERLKDDIDRRAEEFGHVEYYDAKLRDGHSNEAAVAANEVNILDERRQPLASVNPLFAKTSNLPPVPSVDSVAHEHMALNLPAIAREALANLADMEAAITTAAAPSGATTQSQQPSSNPQ